MRQKFFQTIVFLLLLTAGASAQQKILIHMDLQQTNHLKAYGVAYWVLTKGVQVDWMLNYRGGSFMIERVSTAWAPTTPSATFCSKPLGTRHTSCASPCCAA